MAKRLNLVLGQPSYSELMASKDYSHRYMELVSRQFCRPSIKRIPTDHIQRQKVLQVDRQELEIVSFRRSSNKNFSKSRIAPNGSRLSFQNTCNAGNMRSYRLHSITELAEKLFQPYK